MRRTILMLIGLTLSMLTFWAVDAGPAGPDDEVLPLVESSLNAETDPAFEPAPGFPADDFPLDDDADAKHTEMTLAPTKDSHISSAQAASNYGSAHSLQVKNGQNILMGFNVASAPAAAQIIAVNLYVRGYYPTMSPMLCRFKRIISPWTETGVTWNNRPTTTTIDQFEDRMPSGDDWESYDVTRLYQAARIEGVELGILIESTSGPGQTTDHLCSREHSDPSCRPYLKISYRSAAPAVRLVHIADLHVDRTPPIGNYDNDGWVFKQLAGIFANFSAKPAFVLASGDIANVGEAGSTGNYDKLTQHLYPSTLRNPVPGALYIDAAKTIPLYCVTGNHDYRYATLLTDQTPEHYPLYIGPLGDYHFTKNDVVVIGMNTGWDDDDDLQPEGSGFSTGQLTNLETLLDGLDGATNGRDYSGKRKVIFMHHPGANARGTRWDGSAYTGRINSPADGCVANNRETFLDLCDQYKVDVVLEGHVEQSVVNNRDGVVVSRNWTGGTRFVQSGPAFMGCYRLLELSANSVWISEPFRNKVYQMRNNTPAYSWYTTSTATGITANDQSKKFTLPFTFKYYGIDYVSVNVSSNGFLSFSSSAAAPSPAAIPSKAEPNTVVAPFWRDLNPAGGGKITYLSNSQVFVVTWSGVKNAANSKTQSFQVALKKSGEILFNYGAITNDVTTVCGIENQAGTTGIATATKPVAQTSVKFTPVELEGKSSQEKEEMAPDPDWLQLTRLTPPGDRAVDPVQPGF